MSNIIANAVNLMGIKLIVGTAASLTVQMKQPDGQLLDGSGVLRSVYAEPRLVVSASVTIRNFIADFYGHRTNNPGPTGRYTYAFSATIPPIHASNLQSAQTFYDNDAEHQYAWVYTVSAYGPAHTELYASSGRQIWIYQMEYKIPSSDTRSPGIEFHMDDPSTGLALSNGQLYIGHWVIGNVAGTYGGDYQQMALYYTNAVTPHDYRFRWWVIKMPDRTRPS